MDDQKPKWHFPNMGKSISTLGIWICAGLASVFSPELADSIIWAVAMTTVLIWLYGSED